MRPVFGAEDGAFLSDTAVFSVWQSVFAASGVILFAWELLWKAYFSMKLNSDDSGFTLSSITRMSLCFSVCKTCAAFLARGAAWLEASAEFVVRADVAAHTALLLASSGNSAERQAEFRDVGAFCLCGTVEQCGISGSSFHDI